MKEGRYGLRRYGAIDDEDFQQGGAVLYTVSLDGSVSFSGSLSLVHTIGGAGRFLHRIWTKLAKHPL